MSILLIVWSAHATELVTNDSVRGLGRLSRKSSGFPNAWTNYWLLRDARQGRAVVTDIRTRGTVGHRYRVDGSEYIASADCPYEGSVPCMAGESIRA